MGWNNTWEFIMLCVVCEAMVWVLSHALYALVCCIWCVICIEEFINEWWLLLSLCFMNKKIYSYSRLRCSPSVLISTYQYIDLLKILLYSYNLIFRSTSFTEQNNLFYLRWQTIVEQIIIKKVNIRWVTSCRYFAWHLSNIVTVDYNICCENAIEQKLFHSENTSNAKKKIAKKLHLVFQYTRRVACYLSSLV